jgi:probable O-glycosylation ligase (exosortase A-associated)
MRDLYIALIVLGLLPAVLLRPFIGVLLWTWLSLMAPHRLAWGFSYDFPYVQVIAVVSVLGLFFSREKVSFPVAAPTVLFICFTLWVCVTTIFALSPELAQGRLVFVLKIFALAYFALLITNTRERLHTLVWMIVLSIGFYGVKGGVFTLLSGGGNRVYGPSGSFIEDNNHMALAMVMMVPLFRYLQLNSELKLIRVGLIGAMSLSIVSALGSYSRGAMLALSATLVSLVAKTRRRLLVGLVAFIAFVGAVIFLPQSWHERMATLQDEEVDASTQGRFEIWQFSAEIALDRPIVGGGFDMLFDLNTYTLYNSTIKPRSAHSIIFQVLGEHGFVGLGLFLGIGLSLMLKARWIRKATKGRPDLQWAADLASMCQVSLIGYFVAGLFLNLGFFDLIYLYIPVVVGTALVVQRELSNVSAGVRAGVPAAVGEPRPRPALGLRQL